MRLIAGVVLLVISPVLVRKPDAAAFTDPCPLARHGLRCTLHTSFAPCDSILLFALALVPTGLLAQSTHPSPQPRRTHRPKASNG
jgi:hypothetical protein